jgi:hypothetical protein
VIFRKDTTVTPNQWRIVSRGPTAAEQLQAGSGTRPSGPAMYAIPDPPNSYTTVTATSYTVIAEFAFPGSSIYGTIFAIYATCHRSGVSTMDVRVWDVTNGLVIAEKTGIADGTPTIQTLTMTPANLPAGQARFEVQIKANAGGTQARISGWTIQP